MTLVAVLLAGTIAAAQPLPPELTAPVNDFAGVIDGQSKAQLDQLIRGTTAPRTTAALR